jgi:hypothetical protein
MGFEVFEQDMVGAEQHLHAAACGQPLQVTAKDQAIKAIQNAQDKSAKGA